MQTTLRPSTQTRREKCIQNRLFYLHSIGGKRNKVSDLILDMKKMFLASFSSMNFWVGFLRKTKSNLFLSLYLILLMLGFVDSSTFAGHEIKITVKSIPTCRETLRAEKNVRYFALKHLEICAHLNTSCNFL